MIDTVKFRIPIDEKGYEALLQNSNVHTGFDYKTKNRQYLIIKTPINVGSDSRERILRIPREFSMGGGNYAELELSIPKYLNGQNVQMITVDMFKFQSKLLCKDLETHLGLISNVDDWKIQRIDFCYNWKLASKEQLTTYIHIFQNLDYVRKKKFNYDTSTMYIGSAYTVKIYSKYEEYLAHDYKVLFKFNDDYAINVLNMAENMLRFEITIKKPHFETVFGPGELYIKDITEDVVLRTLNAYLSKLAKLRNISISESDTNYNKLINTYGQLKGRDLFQKLCMWASEDPVMRGTFESYSYSNRYKFFQALKKANVSLMGKNEESSEINLAIPSEYALYTETY